jgi:hypothetical protein
VTALRIPTAAEIAPVLAAGVYWFRFDTDSDDGDPPDDLQDEVRALLRDRGLTLRSDATGMLVCEIERVE